jgi:hypothetical protein
MSQRSGLLVLLLASCVAGDPAERPDDPGKADTFGDAPDGSSTRVCPPSTTPGMMACHARVATTPTGEVPYLPDAR